MVSARCIGAVVGVLLVAGLAVAQTASGQSAPGGASAPGTAQRKQATVESAMKNMEKAFEQLEKQLAEGPRKERSLKLVGDLQRNCIIAKGLGLPKDVVDRLAKTDEDELKLRTAFRTDLLNLARKLLDLEQALLDDKLDVARLLLAEVHKLSEASHHRFGVEEHHEHEKHEKTDKPK